MIKPVRIQRSRQHKQVSPNGLPVKYCGRPTKWGNPYIPYVAGNTPEDCVRKFEQTMSIMLKQDAKKELKGINLSCWCKLGDPCHVDVLLKIANE